MSDPVQNSQVEDVLSSIRRLVSEDKRPLQAPKIDKPAPKEEPANGRLVLTPALRVGENEAVEEEPEAAADEGATNAQSAGRKETFADLVTDDVLLDVYPHEGSAASDDEAETSALIETKTSVDEIAEDYSTDPYNFDEDEPGTDAVLASPSVADVEVPALETDEDGGPELADQDEMTQPATVVDEATDPASGDVDDLSDRQSALAEDDGTDAKDTGSLSAKIEALETAISNISDTWEPDDPGDSDYAGTEPEAMEWEDDEPEEDTGRATFVRSAASFAAATSVTETVSDLVEEPQDTEPEPKPVFSHKSPEAEMPGADQIEHASEPEPEAVQDDLQEHVEAASTAAEEDTGIDLEDDSQLIDEDALRDLVSEIVREELQGALGERITRNVRKLVRREIHRALTAQELE